MYEVSFIIMNIFLVVTTLWIVNKFLIIFLEEKRKNIFSIIAWIVFALFQFYCQYNIGNASVWRTIINTLLVFIITIVSFSGKYKKKLFIVVLLYTIWVLVEMITYFCMNFFQIKITQVHIIGAVLSKIIMIISVFSLFNVWKKTNMINLPNKLYYVLFIIPIGSIYIAAETFFIMNLKNNLVTAMMIFSILLVFNIIIFEIYSKLVQFFTFEQEKTVYTQQLDIISRNTEEQKKIMEKFHEEKHNLVNELIILKHNTESGEYENVLINLNHIINAYETKENISCTGNEVIDAIINFKYAIAKEKGIRFVLKIFVPEEMPINQCDIGIVIGNAIDNAIEATSECISSEKIIQIIMGSKKEAFVMIVKNPFEYIIKKDKTGNLLSTKEDSFRHGYGVNAIKRVAEKYNGEVVTEMSNKIFSLTVIMGFR